MRSYRSRYGRHGFDDGDMENGVMDKTMGNTLPSLDKNEERVKYPLCCTYMVGAITMCYGYTFGICCGEHTTAFWNRVTHPLRMLVMFVIEILRKVVDIFTTCSAWLLITFAILIFLTTVYNSYSYKVIDTMDEIRDFIIPPKGDDTFIET